MTSSTTDFLATARRVITREAEALTLLAASLGDSFSRAVELILEAQGRVIVSGMGKSGHIARKLAATLASTGTPAQFVHPAEASHGDLGMITEGDVLLVLSNSGETPELADIIAHTRRFSIPLIGIASRADSTLLHSADVALTLPDAPEACETGIVPTTSTTMTLALGDALAIALMEHRRFTPEHFRLFHPGGKLGAKLMHVRELMHADMPLVPESTPMSEALLAMSRHSFGVVGVTDPTGALAGIITDGDLRRHMQGLLDPHRGRGDDPHPPHHPARGAGRGRSRAHAAEQDHLPLRPRPRPQHRGPPSGHPAHPRFVARRGRLTVLGLGRNNLHSTLVAWLKILLPLTALVILSTLFLVANRVNPEDAIPYADVNIADRLKDPRLTNATFAGMTQDGAAVSLKASDATPGVPGSSSAGKARGLTGQIETPDGVTTNVAGAEARLDQQKREILVTGGVTLDSSSGYHIATDRLALALDRTRLESGGAVTAQLPFGQLSAGKMLLTRAASGNYVMSFTAGVRLIYQPRQTDTAE